MMIGLQRWATWPEPVLPVRPALGDQQAAMALAALGAGRATTAVEAIEAPRKHPALVHMACPHCGAEVVAPEVERFGEAMVVRAACFACGCQRTSYLEAGAGPIPLTELACEAPFD